MSETGQGRSPPSPSLPVLLFTSPTWQISIPTLQLPFLLLTHAHTHSSITVGVRQYRAHTVQTLGFIHVYEVFAGHTFHRK